MSTRKRCLETGWYPDDRNSIAEMIEEWGHCSRIPAVSGIAPHAGWYFSGKLALKVIETIPEDIETVVVAGGHLSESSKIIAGFEDDFETPCGNIQNDMELLNSLKKSIEIGADKYPDNTVEVELPLIKFFHPNAEILYLRVPPSDKALELGKILSNIKDKNIFVLGSTDLTHYGPNYSFSPQGQGNKALQWVKNVNDKNFIDLLLNLKMEEINSNALENKSACSPGAAAFALSYALNRGAEKSELLGYYTSFDIYPSSSFVGYAGVAFRK